MSAATPQASGTAATPPVSGTAATPPVPGRREVEASVQVIHDHAERLFLWDYERDRGQLVTLYNKAMGSQWNSVTDLDWSIEVDPERLVAEQDSPILTLARVVRVFFGQLDIADQVIVDVRVFFHLLEGLGHCNPQFLFVNILVE